MRFVRACAVVVVGAGLGVGVAGIGGCSRGEPVADPTPTVSRSARPSPEPTPTPSASPKPERPAAMDEVGVDGAVAAATYFLQLYPYVYNTGDLVEWQAMSHPECVFCASVVENVGELEAAGTHSEGGSVQVSKQRGTEVNPGVWFSVDIEAVEAPSKTVDASGSVIDDSPDRQTHQINLIVVRDGEQWLIRGVQVDAPPANG